MALNLSTLTSSATSGDVLAEALTTADFLENVPVLRNLARGSQKGGDAKQDVALNQPKALPLIDGDGYLYLSGVSGNNARIADSDSLTFLNDIEIIVNFKVLDDSTWRTLVSKYQSSEKEYLLTISNTDSVQFYRGGGGSSAFFVNFNTSYADLKPWIKATHRLSDGRCQLFFSSDGITWNLFETLTMSAVTPSNSSTDFFIGGFGSAGQSDVCKGAIKKVIIKDGIDGTEELNIDFTATNIRHGDTKFKCATGQVVTINQSGNDPSTVIKKSVLRFDGVTNGLKGLFNQTITDGYMFAAFSVLGNGGESSARVFSINSTGGADFDATGAIVSGMRGVNLSTYDPSSGWITLHSGLTDDANGDILHDIKFVAGAQKSRVNDADESNQTISLASLSAEGFNIGDAGTATDTSSNACIDLEFLALFPASITDAQADDVRKYINNRNNVFLRHDTDGYYFFDGAATTDGQVFSGSSSWLGRIVGSDNDDPFKYLSNGSINDRPTTDGYKITFADNSDHFLFNTPLSNGLAGWQVVGTSLGTFAYRVNANAVTELNLLGNLGQTAYRKTGDLYGVILLPESATGADIEAARSLLIDRGAADGTTSGTIFTFWYNRDDIVEFKHINTSSVTYAAYAWYSCQALEKFPALDLSNSSTLSNAWLGCTELSDFGAIQADSCGDFTYAWRGCFALTSFPAGAKLGTEANNVNFNSAWRSSGLTSFSTPLPTADNLFKAWATCLSLESFSAPLTSATLLNYTWNGCTALDSFSSELSSVVLANNAWQNCTSLTDFSADVFANWNPSSITSGVFNDTWDGCTALTAQSVENILTSIDASGQYATSDGDAYVNGVNTQLADAGIAIDYDGTTLSAATNSAIDSLSGKGWEVYINGVLVIPNILDLEPAAAYSLRSFDSDADPNVVNVRRSSDNATSDFKASEVSDGTLTTWVGEQNLITYSNSFVGNWSRTSSSTTTAGQAGYDGTNDATEFYDSRSNTSFGLYKVISSPINGQINASIYLKAGTVSTGQLDLFYPGGAIRAVSFDLSNGTVEAGILGGSSQVADAVGITNVGNGWYRVNLTQDSGSPLLQYLRVGLSSAGTIFIQDAQVVDGASVRTYVETNASQSGDGHVTTWYDQGGTNHAAQATASSQPKIVDGGTLVTEGGLAAVDFDGVSGSLNMNYSDLYGQSTLNSFYVTSTDDDAYMIPSNPASANYGFVAQLSTSSGIHSFYGNPSLYVNSALQSVTTREDVQTAQDGYKLIHHESGNTSSWTAVNFGRYSSGWVFDGKLQEMIFFNTDQSANRTGIEANIMDTYSIS